MPQSANYFSSLPSKLLPQITATSLSSSRHSNTGLCSVAYKQFFALLRIKNFYSGSGFDLSQSSGYNTFFRTFRMNRGPRKSCTQVHFNLFHVIFFIIGIYNRIRPKTELEPDPTSYSEWWIRLKGADPCGCEPPTYISFLPRYQSSVCYPWIQIAWRWFPDIILPIHIVFLLPHTQNFTFLA